MSPRLLIVGGATVADGSVREWEGYRCECLPRSRAQFCHLRAGVWTAKIDPPMLERFVHEASEYDAVLCETGEALLLVTEWRLRSLRRRPILALEVDGAMAVHAFARWYRDTKGLDPVPDLMATPWVSWITTSEAQASRLERAGIPGDQLHRVPTGASLFTMLSGRAAELLDGGATQRGGTMSTAGRVLFPGNGRRDWDTIAAAILAMPDLECVIIGGSFRDLERRFAALRVRWPANLRHLESVPLERYIELVRAAEVAVVPLLPGPGDGGHSTIAIVHRLGVPLVSTDSPALTEYVDGGRSAALCAPGDPTDLVRAIRAVLRDGELRATLIEGGRASERARDVRFRRELPTAIARARACLLATVPP